MDCNCSCLQNGSLTQPRNAKQHARQAYTQCSNCQYTAAFYYWLIADSAHPNTEIRDAAAGTGEPS